MNSSPSRIKFWKMHGLGNDYILIDDREEGIPQKQLIELAKKLCVRRFSIGADGILFLYNSSKADAKMRIFNADGSEAEMCGNGIRCFAKYCYENGIIKKTPSTVETVSGIKKIWLQLEKGKVKMVTVDMGTPIFEREQIPMIGQGKFIDELIDVDSSSYKATCLSVGNPHCVIFVEDTDKFPVDKIGPKIEHHRMFPKRTNVEFVQTINKDEVKVRVWERGVGETFACGTGACAAVAAASVLRKVKDACKVHLLGGDLNIRYIDNKILMTGASETVYEGIVILEDY